MMKTFSRNTILPALTALAISLTPAHADEAGARRVIAEYETSLASWVAQVKAAGTPAERQALWARKPEASTFGEGLLRQLDGSWDQEWILEFAPVLFELAPGYSLQSIGGSRRTPLSAIREAAERFHSQSSQLGPVTLAMTIDNGPKTRAFLENVEKAHPDKKVQGQAAMALALISRELGDGGEVAAFKKRRMELVEKAVKLSGNLQVGDNSMEDIVTKFLFAISNLDKGMLAPDLLGRDVAGEAMRLSDFRGKPVVVVFWHAGMEQAQETADFIKKLQTVHGPQGLVVLGVARESNASLRQLVKDGEVTWPNWVDESGKMASLYQVQNYPATWVLDAQGKVEYRGVPGAFAELTAQALLKN